MIRLAEIADLYGSGEIRLTVWQNFIIPNVPDAYRRDGEEGARARWASITQQSNLRERPHRLHGQLATASSRRPTPRRTRSRSPTISRRSIKLDQPINIHLTGCPNSCAQHYMGDIGLLGTKAKVAARASRVITSSSAAASAQNQAVGRQVFTGVRFEELKARPWKRCCARISAPRGGESVSGIHHAARPQRAPGDFSRSERNGRLA